MLKTIKIRLYPTKQQAEMFLNHFGCCRYVYNNSLAFKINSYKEDKTKLSKFDLVKRLTSLKQEPDKSWLNDVKAEVLQNVMDNIDKAFIGFFRHQTRYPKFKKKSNRQSFVSKQSCRILTNTNKIVFLKHKIKFRCSDRDAKDLRVNTIKHITWIKDCCNHYYAAILIECPNIDKLETLDKSIGIDLGLKSFVVTSDGLFIDNPRFFKESQDKLVKEQKKLSRKKKGSNNRAKQRIKVAKVHNKISNQRNHFLHSIVNKLLAENQSISIEDLNIKGMKMNHHLAKSISDASWSKFLNVLSYKADWFGREVIKIGRFEPTSKTCSVCGWIDKGQKLSDRTFKCDLCGNVQDRDLNAAKNILKISRDELTRSNASREQVSRPSMKEEKFIEIYRNL